MTVSSPFALTSEASARRAAPDMVTDWNFWLRFAIRYPLGYVDRPLALYRTHPHQMTHARKADDLVRIRTDLVEQTVRLAPERLASIRDRALANVYLSAGRILLNQQDRAGARRMLTRSIRLNPSERSQWVYWAATLIPPALRTALGRVRSRLRQSRIPSSII